MKSKKKLTDYEQSIETARDRELARFARIQEEAKKIVRIFHGAEEEDPRFWPTTLRLAAAELEEGLSQRLWRDPACQVGEYEDADGQMGRKAVYRVGRGGGAAR